MSDILLQFVHISDTHIEPEEGEMERREAQIAGVKEATWLPDHLREFIVEHVEAERGETFPYQAAAKASEALVDEINKLKADIDFVLHTGDITNYGEPSEFERAQAVFSNLKAPIHYLNGNHDKVQNLYGSLLGQAAEEKPYDYTFEVKGVKIVCVDSATSGEGLDWRLSDEQLAWLEEQLTDGGDQPIIVGIHHPPFKIYTEWLDYFLIKNWEDIHATLQKGLPRLKGVFCGHVHIALDTYRDGVFYSIVPKPFSEKPGFSVVTVTTQGCQVEHHSFPVAN
jgi:Icc protein